MKQWLLLILTSLYLQALFAQSYWQQQINYTIDVTLNDSAKSLQGFLKLQYVNNSPDTLTYIWFHLWPNAYRNDQTAFSEQLLLNGRTDFYFSDKKDRGYINQLDFRSGDFALKTTDHPLHIDIIQVFLQSPLAPGGSVDISTPFFVKLPKRFSRSGHANNRFYITQWYPKPAVYNQQGWHPMPYLDQGEFFSEFGNFEVSVTIPSSYTIAAPGSIDQNAVNETPISRLNPPKAAKSKHPFADKKKSNLETSPAIPKPADILKTSRFVLQNVHDFAWFAAKDYQLFRDTVHMDDGKTVGISIFAFDSSGSWSKALNFAKQGLRFRSTLIGSYPYDELSVVQGGSDNTGGMEYPAITVIDGEYSDRLLDMVIAHEAGHNWFQSSIASNERAEPWLDEGLNTYYDKRYLKQRYGSVNAILSSGDNSSKMKKWPEDEWDFLYRWQVAIHKDQPVSGSSPGFSAINYSAMVYNKGAAWFEKIEKELGTALFDTSIQTYYRNFRSRHVTANDLQKTFENVSGKSFDSLFRMLDTVGHIGPEPSPKKIRPAFGFNFHNTKQFHYISVMPVIGYNRYDKIMPGLVIHNYNLPPQKFRFVLAPIYSTGAKKINGSGDLKYILFNKFGFQKIEFGTDFSSYSTRAALDTHFIKQFESFSKIAPSVRIQLKESPLSTRRRFLSFKTFFITESAFSEFIQKTNDSINYSTFVTASSNSSRWLNQLSYRAENYRALYPYDYELQFQNAKEFYRVNIIANYKFNYSQGGGLSLRFFAGKFGYLNNGKSNSSGLQRYQPKLLGVTGEEDYTYSNYFIGRSATYASDGAGIPNDGIAAQQIMIRDGGFKLRMDYFGFLQGRSDNWVSSINLNTTLPQNLFPVTLPLRLFLDLGTNAEGWKQDSENPKFMYVAGVQLTLFKDLLNIYAPIMYSKQFRNNLQSVPELNTFTKRLSFSIDIHRLSLRRVFPGELPL